MKEQYVKMVTGFLIKLIKTYSSSKQKKNEDTI